MGSRVRFTDELLENEPGDENSLTYHMEHFVMPESGEPHPENVKFYTEPPFNEDEKSGLSTEGYWTYDFMCIKKEDKVIKERLPDGLLKLRGRKFYWHNDNWKSINQNNVLDHIMKQRIRPILPDHSGKRKRKFCFRVYFDRLNQEELERLRWFLDFADGDCAHKIGRGKPLGFGSARIKIKGLKIRKFYPETGEWNLADKDICSLGNKITENSKAMET